MSRTAPSAPIEHQEDQRRFRIVEDGKEAHLDYRLNAPDIDFHETYVPFAWRGTGLGEKLVKHGLQWAQQRQLNITASCWYADKIYRETP